MNNQELERYKTIVDYFTNNQERIFTKENQKHLTRLYAKLIHQNKLTPSQEIADLFYKIDDLVGGPNYLLRHWGEIERLEAA